MTKFLAKRLSQDRKERKVSLEGEMTAEEADRNVILIYQIPLKRKKVARSYGFFGSISFNSNECDGYKEGEESSCDEAEGSCTPRKKKSRGMENAMLRSSDKDLGPFPSLDKKKLERDVRFPIRCTYQFYRVTDTDDLTERDIHYISEKFESVYKLASEIGSLVIGNSDRVTETTPLKKLSVSSDLPPLFPSLEPKVRPTSEFEILY